MNTHLLTPILYISSKSQSEWESSSFDIDIFPASEYSKSILSDDKSIKIDHIRRLQTELASASQDPQRTRLVIIAPAERITLPAQQALLKLLEEPPENTQIVVIGQSTSSLLPTITSRLRVVYEPGRAGKEETLWTQLSACNNWRTVVTLTQEITGKKEDIQTVLRTALQQPLPADKGGTLFRQLCAEALAVLPNNVSPALCLEHVTLGWYLKFSQ